MPNGKSTKPNKIVKSKGKGAKAGASAKATAPRNGKAAASKSAGKASKSKTGGIVSAIKGALLGKKAAPVKKGNGKAAPAPVKKAGKVQAHKAQPAVHVKSSAKGKSEKAAPEKASKGKNAAVVAPAPVVPALDKKAKGAKGKGATGATVGRGRVSDEAVCREVACEGLSTSGGYCRLHYIKNWKKIKRKELILKEKKLNQYIEELVAKYPDKYIEAIRQDLANDKDFAKVIYDLDLDENADEFDVENESMDSLIDNIKRDFDDEGDAF